MATFDVILVDAKTGNEGAYTFQGSGLLISASPERVARAFFDSEVGQKRIRPAFPDYEIHSTLKHEDTWVVTLMGALIAKTGRRVPFMAMISLRPESAEAAANG